MLPHSISVPLEFILLFWKPCVSTFRVMKLLDNCDMLRGTLPWCFWDKELSYVMQLSHQRMGELVQAGLHRKKHSSQSTPTEHIHPPAYPVTDSQGLTATNRLRESQFLWLFVFRSARTFYWTYHQGINMVAICLLRQLSYGARPQSKS